MMRPKLRSARDRFKRVAGLCYIIVLVGLCHAQTGAPESGGQRGSTEWQKREVEGIPYELALETRTGKPGEPGSRQVMFILLDEKRFSEDSVLRIFRHVHSQVPRPTTVFVTLLTDRGTMSERLRKRNWESSLDDTYSRLTQQPQNCCPSVFKGAQLDRYVSKSIILMCNNGTAKEFVLEH